MHTLGGNVATTEGLCIQVCIIFHYTTGPLNAWIWLADEHSKVCNYFQGNARTANVVPGSSWPHCMAYQFAKWFELFQRSYNSKITKTHNETGQTNKYSKQKDKNDRSCPCFCHKITLYYIWKAHTLSLPLSLPHRPHIHNSCLHTH